MKTSQYISGLMLVATIVFLSSCAQTVHFQNSSMVPAAQGKVKVKQDDNKNYRIQINITDLADIQRLDPSKETYVAWMETRQGNTENIGQLKSAGSLFSKQKKATLETVTSYEPAKIFITAEKDHNLRYPGNQVVLTTGNFKP
jgi:hypothetical protein